LQAAVDYVANLGGGTVRIGAGRFEMRDSLKIQDNTRVIGVPAKTILVSCDAHQSKLTSSGGVNERQVTVVDPSGFRIGDGIMVQDDKSMYGFYVTQATITARIDKNTFRISRPLYHDYSPSRNGRVTSAFPVIGLWGANNVEVEGLTIDGNSDKMQYLTGCRGGGIFLYECENVRIRNCTVKNYNGDAISFQTTQHVVIEDCVCEGNKGVGLHPGCGTVQATVRRTRCAKNGGDGLFLCWRVKHSLFENNDFSHNLRHGISIGMKDSDNQFRDNMVTSNTKSGIFFRQQPAANGAHRNVFEKNRILDNGVCVKIEGEHHELIFRGNRIGFSKPPAEKQTAIVAGDGAKKLTASDNEFVNVDPI
jgi:parallel beta-helix repeat protein